MSTDGKNTQKLTKTENEIKKSTHTSLIENQSCFEDEDEDEEDQALKNYDNKETGLEMARSSCADDILMKTLIAKYANRLMDKLEKIAINVPANSDQADVVGRLRRKIQRLLNDVDQAGGPSDSSTVLLNKYDCLRMAYYGIANRVKGTKRLPFSQGVLVTAGRLNNRKNCDKIRKCKESENRKKLENQEQQNNCENHDKLEIWENCENEKRENLMKLENQEKLDNCKTTPKKLEKWDNHENNEKPENNKKFQAGEKLENLEKRVLNCEYCGRETKFFDATCDPKLHSDKEDFQKNVFEWKSFFSRRFFICLPYFCCISCEKTN